MTKKEAINYFLSESINPDKTGNFSSFTRALYEIRKTTGRNQNTGKRIAQYESNSWLGAIGYMSLLDTLGTCFELKPLSKFDKAIQKTFDYFAKPSLNEDQIYAIYALRNAFAHDFSLYNLDFKNNKLMHNFIVRDGSNNKVVELPKTYWDGKFENRSDDNQTIVYLEKFGDIVEDICKTIILLAKDEKLEIALKGGVAELINRYTFTQKISIKAKFSEDSKIFKVHVTK